MQTPRWTLDELAERVDAALAVDYHGQPSGRVRDVPDRRAIRWYTTIGLIDRPVGHRGRTALYGPRHLLQLVAVKRLQARGLPLVAIQRELAGATDTRLARVARLPAAPVPSAGGGPSERDRVGGVAATAARRPPAVPPATVLESVAGTAPVAGARARRASFWLEQPTAFLAAAADPGGASEPAGERVATLRGVRLGEGATLLLEPGRDLDASDLGALLDAAQPLLTVLRQRGLGREPGTPTPTPAPAPAPAPTPAPALASAPTAASAPTPASAPAAAPDLAPAVDPTSTPAPTSTPTTRSTSPRRVDGRRTRREHP